jgi:hypothetical protein
MKVAGIIIVVLALVVGIVPQFTDCESQGRALTLTNGNTAPMKCHWTAMAALGMAIPLLALGGVMAFSRRKEAQRALSMLGVAMGTVVALLPTYLIGVCANAMMLCNNIMEPTLILSGVLIGATSLVTLALARKDEAQPSLPAMGQPA